MKSKEIYRVADLGLAICFTHSSVLSDLDHMCLPIDADRFRFNLHEVLKPTMDSGVTSIVSCYNFKVIFNLIAYLRSYRHLKAPFNCNFPTIDVDVVGHMKLLNEQMLIQRPVLHEVAIATTQCVLIHLQTNVALVLKLSVCTSLSQNSYKLYMTFPGTPTTFLQRSLGPF
ncbi:hypothetical protein HID58_000771 [Brassica napus]|uniref:Uncharacterized protein n=2 Tax=Brassica napus TaxID=3708 RepID=A0ABQ8DW60_BRANA|nr:hypothetical protein HID58_010035 [Brassica napus]KAH0941134.1 hypothetical protein HID58_000771 [Brassica napus]